MTYRNVLLEALVELLQALLDALVVALESRVLDVLGDFSERIDVAVGEFLELVVGLLYFILNKTYNQTQSLGGKGEARA